MPKIKNTQREIASLNEIKELIIPQIIKTVANDYAKFGDRFDEDDKIRLYEENIKGITATKMIITFDAYEQEKPVVTEKGIFIGFKDSLKTLTLFSVFYIIPIDDEHLFYQQTFELVGGNELIDITENDYLY